MALGTEHVITLDWTTYAHVGAIGESWVVANDGRTEARWIVEAASGTTVTKDVKIGTPLTPDHALGGTALAALVADGDTVAGHLYLRGSGVAVRTDMADGVAAPV